MTVDPTHCPECRDLAERDAQQNRVRLSLSLRWDQVDWIRDESRRRKVPISTVVGEAILALWHERVRA